MTAPEDEVRQNLGGDRLLDVVVVGGSQAGLAMAGTFSARAWTSWSWRPPPSRGMFGARGGIR
jgi:hypothetical protein